MGADIKALKSRIRSVDSTLHLTSAMGLVASSKMRKANLAMQNGRDYTSAFSSLVSVLLASPDCARSPYMTERPNNRARLIVIAGDRGLAGGYNANVFRMLRELAPAEIIPIGKRACERFGKPTVSSESFSSTDAAALARTLCADYLSGEYDLLGILSTHYHSMMSHEPEITRILPLERHAAHADGGVIFEPDERTVLDSVVPEYVAGLILAAVRESYACEVAARRIAMDAAGKNAQSMIDDLSLQYNRARQSAITQEITEIVAGGNA
ncbi:MAG: ATP synthase F1 subunit gamma [Candidatus Faecivicinus sp.]|nr:ATP synthase F1 subunit gamma [Candidatus Faecivicinus sp.]